MSAASFPLMRKESDSFSPRLSGLTSGLAHSTAILHDSPAKFELLHGDPWRNGPLLPTTVTVFCHQLREVLNKIARDHADEPGYLLTIDTAGTEFEACVAALDGWNPRTRSLPEIKAALVQLFITSPSLGALVIQVRSSVPVASFKLSCAPNPFLRCRSMRLGNVASPPCPFSGSGQRRGWEM